MYILYFYLLFMKYIYTLLDEKKIDLEDTLEFKNEKGLNIMSYGVITEYISQTGKENIKKIKNVLRKIDFVNGDIKDFLLHIARNF